MSLRKIVLLTFLSGVFPVHAAEEFPNGLVPAEVVSEFAGGPVIKGLPDDFPALVLPDLGLRLVGSMQRDAYAQVLILRSPLARETLHERLLAAMAAQGWIDLAAQSAFGLIFSGMSTMSLCHEQHGQMSVRTTAANGESRVEVTRIVPPAQLNYGCAAQLASALAAAELRNFYGALVPVLEVPQGTVPMQMPNVIRSGSSSFYSNSAEVSRQGNIQVPETTAAAIHADFAEQMQEQGWRADSSASGEFSATSVWKRSVTPPAASAPVDVFVTLNIVSGTNDYYGVELKLQTPPSQNSGAGIIGITPL